MNKKLILLVEDNELNRKIISEFIAIADYKSFLTSSAEEALGYLENNTPDLILMDTMLPGMNGIEATMAIKSSDNRNIPIIALSAYSSEKDIRTALDAGCIDYLTKPISLNRFIETLNKYLG